MAIPNFQSFVATPMIAQNFQTISSAKLVTGASSASVTFSTVNGTIYTTFKITNKGTTGAYIGWGTGSATAVASSGTPTASCDYIPAGAVEILNFPPGTNTIAAIEDTATTTLEISIGFGN